MLNINEHKARLKKEMREVIMEENGWNAARLERFERWNEEYETLFYEPWREYTKPFHIAGNVYYVGNTHVSMHLIATTDGLILYDTGFQHCAPMIMQAILDLGFDPRNVKYVVLTHGHFDHYGSASWFQGMYGAKICMGQLDVGRIELPHLGTIPRDDYANDEFTTDIELRTGDRITLGDTTLEFVEFPGHSPGTVISYMNTVEDGRPIRFCFLCGGGPSVLKRELTGGTELGEEMLKRRLAANEIVEKEHADVITCGHPYQLAYHAFEKLEKREKEGGNPFICDTDYAASIREETEAFKKVLEEVR